MNAGGYNSDFGSDYGVGLAHHITGREATAVAGFHGRSGNGVDIPWLGLRFGELLSEQLAPVLGAAPATWRIDQALAAHGVHPAQAGCPPEEGDMANLPALRALRANLTFKRRSLCLVLGEITASGLSPHQSSTAAAVALMRPTTVLTVRARVLRNLPHTVVAASHIVTVRAPGREWAQMPARVALALIDDMGVSLGDDERIALVRAASPLLAAASSLRVRCEVRLGDAAAAALGCKEAQAKLSAAAYAARAHSVQAELRRVAALPAQRSMRDGDALVRIHRSALAWLSYANGLTAAPKHRRR
jgi:hypothetical protein